METIQITSFGYPRAAQLPQFAVFSLPPGAFAGAQLGCLASWSHPDLANAPWEKAAEVL